jgi:hypothetical protein
MKWGYSKSSLGGWQASWNAKDTYKLTDSKLKEITFDGTVEVEDVNVSYPYGLQKQADYIASQINDSISSIESSTGLEICYGAKVYLLRFEEIPQSYEMNFKSEPNNFCLPLFVEAGNESCEAIISQNTVYPGMFMHELAEMSLFLHNGPGVVLPDAKWEKLFLKANILNYTRWFREGFASYAGFLALEMIRSDINCQYHTASRKTHSYPFSSLDKVGKDLFRWHQYSDDNLNRDYYNAALGLFLVIRDRFGESTIKEIILKIKKQDYLDGLDLVEISNATLNTDIKELADSFYFPETGLKMKPLALAMALNEGLDITGGLFVTTVESNSPADAAGIKEKDVIVRVNNKPVHNNLDFELSIFESMEQSSADILINRREVGEVIAELKLTKEN